MSNKINPSSR